MLWLIFFILLLLWLGGFALDLVGGLIHIVLVIAVIVLILNLIGFGGRRTM
jgi:hypothetical protein